MDNIYNELKKEFLRKYTQTLLPLLKYYENQRKKRLNILLCVRIFIVIFAVVHEISFKYNDILIIIILCVLFFVGSNFIIKKTFEFKVKQELMPTICSCFRNLKWHFGEYNTPFLYRTACLINSYDDCYVEDIFSGSWNKINFEIVEAHLSTHASKKEERIFDGVILRILINKNFLSHSIIENIYFKHYPPEKKLERIKLDSINSRNQFNFYSDDSSEAAYLINSELMDELDKMAKTFKAKIYSAVFYKNCFYIAFTDKKEMFSAVDIHKPLNEAGEITLMLEELLAVYKLIDYFRPDLKQDILRGEDEQ